MPYRFSKLNYGVVRDKRRRATVEAYEFRRKILRSTARDERFPRSIRRQALAELATFPKNSNPVRTMNRCTATGASRSVDRRLKRSRIAARQRINDGRYVGIGKASW
jgi:small subunit ribosomal protein S14